MEGRGRTHVMMGTKKNKLFQCLRTNCPARTGQFDTDGKDSYAQNDSGELESDEHGGFF